MTSKLQSVSDLLGLLQSVDRTREGQWTALCPGHADQKPSLRITEVNGKILLKCFAGCELADILRPLSLEPKDLFLNSSKGMVGYTTIGKPCQPVNGMPKQLRNRVDTPKTNGVNSVNGLTLAALAEAKLLPAAFLKSLGVSDFKLSGLPVVRIPYAPKWPHAHRDVRLATVLGHLLGVKGPDRQGWYRAPVASTKVTERRGFQTRYKTILERLRMSDLSRRKPAKELGIGYATLKGLIDSQNRIQAKDTGA